MAQRRKGRTRGASRRKGKPASPRRAQAPLSDECQQLLALIKQRCPELLPRDPLPPGTVGPDVALTANELQPLFRAAADSGRRGSVVWVAGDSELLVQTREVSARFAHGLVTVSIPVHCEETGAVSIDVPFSVGDDREPAGMFAATETRPRGPVVITDIWGDALVAFAWKLLVTVAGGIADRAGRDVDGAGLIPAALTVEADGMRVLTQARHVFDRVQP